MLSDERIQLVGRVAGAQGVSVGGRQVSILTLAAASYTSRPAEDATVPTGYDPVAVLLFEAIVEGAYLVAVADGVIDADERRVFERVLNIACGGVLLERQVSQLITHLAGALEREGIDARVAAVAAQVHTEEHAREVLRIAALLALASDDVSAVEMVVLEKLAHAFGLAGTEVEVAVQHVRAIVSEASRS